MRLRRVVKQRIMRGTMGELLWSYPETAASCEGHMLTKSLPFIAQLSPDEYKSPEEVSSPQNCIRSGNRAHRSCLLQT
jgi:hypothetical protein